VKLDATGTLLSEAGEQNVAGTDVVVVLDEDEMVALVT
jgi:hypothetical protein